MESKLSEVQRNLNPELYSLFWYISLPTLFVPSQHYEAEIKRINDEIAVVKAKEPKNKKEIDRLSKLAKMMQNELE
jgi:hypothetical protein